MARLIGWNDTKIQYWFVQDLRAHLKTFKDLYSLHSFVGDFNIINGVLRTGHSLFKKYRYEFKSQRLWTEIKFVLDTFSKPLTDLFVVSMLHFDLDDRMKKILLKRSIFPDHYAIDRNPEIARNSISRIQLVTNDFQNILFVELSGRKCSNLRKWNSYRKELM